jgi:hypothetical protein
MARAEERPRGPLTDRRRESCAGILAQLCRPYEVQDGMEPLLSRHVDPPPTVLLEVNRAPQGAVGDFCTRLTDGVSTIGAVAGPPDDFHNQPTRHQDVGMGDPPPSGEPPPHAPEQFEPPESLDPLDEDAEPIAWYRRPVVLIGWGLMVLILIALIVYGIIELIGDQGSSGTPSTTTTPSPTTSTTTPPPTTTTATTTPPSTTATTTTAPPTSRAVPPPAHQPPQEPTHRHHWPSWLPTTIPALP